MSVNYRELERILALREQTTDTFLRGSLDDLFKEKCGEAKSRRRIRNLISYAVTLIAIALLLGCVVGFFLGAFGYHAFAPSANGEFIRVGAGAGAVLLLVVLAHAFPDQAAAIWAQGPRLFGAMGGNPDRAGVDAPHHDSHADPSLEVDHPGSGAPQLPGAAAPSLPASQRAPALPAGERVREPERPD